MDSQQETSLLGTVFHQSLLLNSDGLKKLQSGNTVEACNSFAEASSLLRDQYCQSQTLKAGCKRPINWVQLSSQPFLDSRYRQKEASDEDSLPILFLRALNIASIPADSPFTWAILYNLALSCHIHGCRLGANGRQHMQKAHELYDVIRTQFLPHVSSDYSPMLSLAVHNNMGCIYREFSMHKESQECLKRAKEMLLAVSGEQGGLDDLKDVSLNLMALKKPARAPAA